MNQAPFKPCATWATRLAARHPSDLSPAEHADLQAHLQTCPACASAADAYTFMERAIHNLPPVAPPAEFALEQPTYELGEDVPQPIKPRNYLNSRPRPQPSRLLQRANLLAAVLIVAVLIVGSSLLYIHLPLPALGGVPQVSCTNDKNLGDPVSTLLCLHQHLVNINQSRTIGDYTITLQRGYVDANQLLIVYKISTHTPISGVAQRFDVTLQNLSHSIFLGAIAMGMGGGGKLDGDYSEKILLLNRGTFPQDLQVFDLHVTMHNFLSTESLDQPSTHQSIASFSFSLPFHPGQILNQHVTVRANGTTYTLYQTIITPSFTNLYVSGLSWLQVDQYTLTLNGKTLKNYVEGATAGMPKQPPYTVFAYENDQPFQGHGTLTLSADVYSDNTRQQETRYTWTMNLP